MSTSNTAQTNHDIQDSEAYKRQHRDHMATPGMYMVVFVALMILLFATAGLDWINLGPWNTVLAMFFAFFKAALVVMFFMHVKWGSRLTQMLSVIGLFFLLIMMGFILTDEMTRYWLVSTPRFHP